MFAPWSLPFNRVVQLWYAHERLSQEPERVRFEFSEKAAWQEPMDGKMVDGGAVHLPGCNDGT